MTRQESVLARRWGMRPRILVLTLSAFVAMMAGCGGGDDDKVAPAPPPTAPALAGDLAPLTGLPQPDVARRQRVALVVKIDNAPRARPQAGLNQADVVMAERVEDGVTRLFTVFHSNDADPVGPVRSARSTDIALAASLRRPLFAYSGTNALFQQQLKTAPLVDVGVDVAPGDYRRQGGRPAPYNLFTSTPALFRRAPGGATAPGPLFVYRPAGQPLAAAGAAPAAGAHLEYRGRHITTVVDWGWDAGAGGWRRAQDGTPHVDTAGAQVVAKNVVVQFVEYRDTGLRDRSNTAVPEAHLMGEGEAWVLTDGKSVRGRWSKPTPEAVTSYTDAGGRPIGLTPGTTWVELAPPGAAQLRG